MLYKDTCIADHQRRVVLPHQLGQLGSCDIGSERRLRLDSRLTTVQHMKPFKGYLNSTVFTWDRPPKRFSVGTNPEAMVYDTG